MLKVGCIGFGGGNALIPIMHKTFVKDKTLISPTEYEEDVVVSSITPGALTIKLAGAIGSRIYGWRGMLAGFSGMAIPGVVLTLVLLSLLTNLPPELARQIEFLTIGVSAYITCMLSDYVMKTITASPKETDRTSIIGIILLVFLLICGKNLYRLIGMDVHPFFSLASIDIFAVTFFVILYVGSRPTVWRSVIAVALCIGYILCAGKMHIVENDRIFFGIQGGMLLLSVYGLHGQLKELSLRRLDVRKMWKELVVLLLIMLLALAPAYMITKDVLTYAGNGILSAMMSFGGGDAYLTVADGMFVSTGLVSEDVFYGTIVPIVNIVPGSILCKMLSGIGYCIGVEQSGSIAGGYVLAFVGFACSLVSSCGMVSVVGCLYRCFGELPIFQQMKKWIRPIVSGLMLGVILSLVYQSKASGIEQGMGWTGVFIMLGIYVCNLIMFYKKKSGSVKMVIVSIVLSMVLCNLFYFI